MAINNFFRDVGILNAKKQTVMIDAATEDAPILATLPMDGKLFNIRAIIGHGMGVGHGIILMMVLIPQW